MYKSILKELAMTEIFALVSLLIFVAIFTIAVLYALALSKELVEEMSSVPLEENEPETLLNSQDNEHIQ